VSNLQLKRGAQFTGVSALASSATLVCCVLPVVLVSAGAGATLASLVTRFPQLIWLSQNKAWVFGAAGLLLLLSALVLRWQRGLPCPVDPIAGRQCQKLRQLSVALFSFAVLAYSVGALFAFVVPYVSLYFGTHA